MAKMKAKVVFITGSAKRIGASVAKHLNSVGFNPGLQCHPSLEQTTSLQAE